MEEAKWYVVHTYSGYENKVKANIEKAIENRNLQDQIIEVSVPMQNVIEEKKGEKRQVQKKMFPAYVLVKMTMNEQTWYVVRNTRGVTGFVGPGSKPVPLSEEEIAAMGFVAQAEVVPFQIGDMVMVKAGVWKDTNGVVREVHPAKQMLVIGIDMFGRDTPVEIDFSDVEVV
ncbi:MAG: transcription termination/antitermination protein NusG [Lachnoclostridium sp.]|nr:transcription termination/antitermination protein NusG [Lachnoclostridium sp.]